jgi:hypothetical protein
MTQTPRQTSCKRYNVKMRYDAYSNEPEANCFVTMPDGTTRTFRRVSQSSFAPVKNGPAFVGCPRYFVGNVEYPTFDDVMQIGLGLEPEERSQNNV